MTLRVSTSYAINYNYQQFLQDETSIKKRLANANFETIASDFKNSLSGTESLLDITRAAWTKITDLAEDASTVTAFQEKKAYLKKLVVAYVNANRKDYANNTLAIDTAIEAVLKEAAGSCCCCVIL
jgi:hypothetical protein